MNNNTIQTCVCGCAHVLSHAHIRFQFFCKHITFLAHHIHHFTESIAHQRCGIQNLYDKREQEKHLMTKYTYTYIISIQRIIRRSAFVEKKAAFPSQNGIYYGYGKTSVENVQQQKPRRMQTMNVEWIFMMQLEWNAADFHNVMPCYAMERQA